MKNNKGNAEKALMLFSAFDMKEKKRIKTWTLHLPLIAPI